MCSANSDGGASAGPLRGCFSFAQPGTGAGTTAGLGRALERRQLTWKAAVYEDIAGRMCGRQAVRLAATTGCEVGAGDSERELSSEVG